MVTSIERVAGLLGVDASLISCNGAVVYGRGASGGRPLIYSRPLKTAVARELVAFGKARRYQINFYHGAVIYSEDAPYLRPWIEIYRARTSSPFIFVKNLDDYLHLAPAKLVFVVAPEVRNAIQAELEPRFGARVTMMRTDPEYLEFLEPGTNKGLSLAKLAEALGIPLSQVLALGDGENDIPMLAAAGWSVAVANANPLCRAAARFVTRNDNDHDAVAEALRRWVL